MFKALRLAFPVIVMLAGAANAVEKQAAIDGTSQAVIAPTFLGGTGVGPQSYIRLLNAGTATSTFTVRVVGIPSGTQYGSSFSIAMPARASAQYSISDFVIKAGGTPGAFESGDSSYAIYVSDSDKTAGYQHAVYDWTTSLYENLSNCDSTLDAQTEDQNKEMVLTNVHTSVGPGHIGITFPSTIQLHNRSMAAITYTLKFYNAGRILSTGNFDSASGNLTCQVNRTVQANSTLTLPYSDIEATSGCRPASTQDYTNVVVTDSAGGAPNGVLTHLVRVAQYNGYSDMTNICAVNKIVPVTNVTTVVQAPTTPTAYCGAANVLSPGGYITVSFILSVAPNGRARTVTTGSGHGYYIYGTGIGSVSGSTLTLISQVDGSSTTGTISNGVASGTTTNPWYGTAVAVSASTAACY